jgi:hypothetical protein
MRTSRTIIAIAIAVVGGFDLAGCATPSVVTAAQPPATSAPSAPSANRITPPDPTALQTRTVAPERTTIPQTDVGAVRNSPAWQAVEDLSIDLGLMVDLYTAAAEAGILDAARSSIDSGASVVVADMKSVVGYTQQGAYSVAQLQALATMVTEAGEIATAIDQSSDLDVNAHSQSFQAAAKDFVAAS